MKYILYKTTNLINNYIYIGVHKTETPYEFDKYLGNGVYVNKSNTYEKSKTCFQKAVKEFGTKNFRRETLAVYDTPEEAYNAEKIIVNDEFLARTDVYNMIKGGEIKYNRKVYQYDKNGNFESELINPGTYILKAAILGYLVKDLYYFSFYKEFSYDKARCLQVKNREVHKYSSEGEYIESYSTQEIAEKKNKYSNITKSVKYRTLDKNGFYWSLEKVPYYNRPIHRTKKKVAQLDENGNIIKTWESANSCTKEVGTAVKNVLRGKYDKHKGYIYKYIE